jgi:hypothetical protein
LAFHEAIFCKLIPIHSMTKLSNKIKTALNESRMLILGIQILLGFQFRAFFERGFEALPTLSRYLHLAALTLLLIATVLIMWPSSYHRIVSGGSDATDVHDFTTMVMDIALFPVSIGLGLDFYILTGKTLGRQGGIAFAVVITVLALCFWYGLGAVSRVRRWDRDAQFKRWAKGGKEMRETGIHEKVEQVLIEARMVLPGAQALLGFQFATILMEEFDKLPYASKYIHLIGLGFMGVSVILLMTPAAYHRIVERGEDTEHFHQVASLLLLASMIFLPLGICADLYVVVRKVTESATVAVTSALVAVSFFYGLWFVVTACWKGQLNRS